MFVNIAMFYTWELFVPYTGIFRYWLSLVNGAVIPTSDPCTSHAVSKHLVIVSSSESENREPGQLRNAAVETHDFEVNRQFARRLLASSNANSFGKFGGQIPPVISNHSRPVDLY